MWDTEKEHLKNGTDPVQIPRKHKRALKKNQVVLSSSNWTDFWADVSTSETNPRHWLTPLVTVSIPPKKKKNRGQQHKRGQSGKHFVAPLRGKNSKGKPTFCNGFDQGPKYCDVDHALPTAHLNRLGFLL